MAGIEGENSGTPGTEQARPGPGFRRRVVVKFKDHVQLPRRIRRERWSGRGSVPGMNWLRGSGESRWSPFSPIQPEQVAALSERARVLDPSFRAANLRAYFAVNMPPGTNAEELVRSLSQWDSVAVAYVEPPPVEPPLVTPADDPRSQPGLPRPGTRWHRCRVCLEFPRRRRRGPSTGGHGMGMDLQPRGLGGAWHHAHLGREPFIFFPWRACWEKSRRWIMRSAA